MSLKKNIVSNFFLTSSSLLFPLITFPYITHVLSNDSIGRVFFVDAFTQYFVIISALGIPFYGIREISKIRDDPDKRSVLVAELISIQFILALFSSLAFLVLYYFVPQLKGNLDLIILGCICIVSNAFLIEWFYQGVENFSFITVRSLALKVVGVICILFFVRSASSRLIYYSITVGLVILNSVVNIVNYYKNYHSTTGLTINFRRHIKPLLLLFSINIAVSVYTVLDTIILGLFTNPLSVSYYSVPLRLVKMYWTVVLGVGLVMVPRISGFVVTKDLSAISQLLRKSFSVVFLLTIPFAFFCLLFAKEILFVISSNKYLNSINTLQILSVVPFIVGCCNVLGTQFLMPMGKEKKILQATLVGLCVSLVLNFCLIPGLSYLGSAIACLAAETSVCIYVLVAARKHLVVSIDYLLLVQISISLLVSLLAFYMIHAHYTGLIEMSMVLIIYLISFLSLQLFLFKNSFIYSLIKFSV